MTRLQPYMTGGCNRIQAAAIARAEREAETVRKEAEKARRFCRG